MQDFFKSKKILIIVILVAVSLFFMLRAAYKEDEVTLPEKAVSKVTLPAQKGFSAVYLAIHDTVSDFFHAPSIAEENDRLREENAELKRQMYEFDAIKSENKRMKDFYGIKEENPDYQMMIADVVGRDASDSFYSFTIDKGEKDGVRMYAPCVTKEGLVGLVTTVGPDYAKVSTILDSTCEVGVEILESHDIGVTEGTASLALEGNLKLCYIPRDSKARAGDTVFTTGIGGIFPKGLILGRIKEITPDSQGLTLNAVIEPPIDIRKVTDVMIITDFEGKEEKVD